jgi:molecular chaperone DnaK
MIVGIDLGTTNSLIGAMDAGFPILFADEEGERLTPSVVHIPESGDPIVGRAALPFRLSDPPNTFYSTKRLIGLRDDDVSETFPFAVTGSSGAAAKISARGRVFTPEEIAAMILRKLKADAERAIGQSVTRAVVTVPAYFNDAQRTATKRAGELAGLQVERILSEPTAAALAYGLDKLDEKAHVAVYDLGGGTFDISILELNNGVFEVLATHGDTHLGGDDLDVAIAREFNIPLSEAEKLKRTTMLDASDQSKIENRESRIESACRPLIERTRTHCLRALTDARLTRDQLDQVILVGGATRMPLVQSFVAVVFGREPNTSQHPDEAVALGAAIQAGILEGSVQNVTLLDVTPLSLGIETFGGLMNVLIPRNTTIPVKRGEMFTNAVANQTAMRITVLQGEREMARDNWQLGKFEIAFTPAPKGQARVGVQFEIDADGILRILARDIATGADTVVTLSSAVDVSDEAVEKMLDDSIVNAFEDMNVRILTEAKLTAEEMLPAVAAALDQLGEQVPANEADAINRLVAEVKSAAANNDASRLKDALTRLDEATQPLATLLVERALRA